jgi:DNA-directed RNA polymerase sigma subunit (sigma70/sigma32)
MKPIREQDNHEDGLRSYYAVIKRVALLTAEEERELSARVFSGDEDGKQAALSIDRHLRDAAGKAA